MPDALAVPDAATAPATPDTAAHWLAVAAPKAINRFSSATRIGWASAARARTSVMVRRSSTRVPSGSVGTGPGSGSIRRRWDRDAARAMAASGAQV